MNEVHEALLIAPPRRVIGDNEARVNVTYGRPGGEPVNFDLPDPVHFEATDGDIKGWVTEAVRSGSVPGLPAQVIDLQAFMVERFARDPAGTRDHNLILLRPKTAFGS